MGKPSIILDVSQEIIGKLKKGLIPGVIANEDLIALVNPSESVNYSLSLYLYEIRQLDSKLFQTAYTGRIKESLALSLKYMLSASSGGEAYMKSSDEQRILSAAISVLLNDSVIKKGDNFLGESDIDMHIGMDHLSLDDKNKIWAGTGGIRLSAFYQVSPVFFEAYGETAAKVSQLG